MDSSRKDTYDLGVYGSIPPDPSSNAVFRLKDSSWPDQGPVESRKSGSHTGSRTSFASIRVRKYRDKKVDLDDPLDSDIVNLYLRGCTAVTISKRLDISRSNVYSTLLKWKSS